jgi:hypothetical protein
MHITEQTAPAGCCHPNSEGDAVMKKHPEREQSSSVVHGNGIDEELVRKRAYELYVDRGMEDGHELEDWFRAEEELASKKSQSAAA